MLIDFRGTPLVGFAAAHVVLEIGDNVFVSGAFSFRMGEVETVQVVTGGLPPLTIADLNVRTIKVGAEGVSVFLGDGLADYDIDADLADYLSTDTPAVVLVGQTVGNLVDGKIYRRVGSSLGSVGGPALDLAGQDYFDASVWRPVAADFVGGQTAAVAVGETVGVFDAGAATYRVFERLNTGLASGPLSELVADYTGSADWVELTVFFNGDGTLNMDELGPDAVGFFVEDGALGLVLASAQTSQLPVNTAHRTKSFTALKATAASVGLVGFEDAGFVFTLRDIVVEVNSGSPVLPGQVAPTIDWAGSFPATGGYPVETGDPDNPVLIDFRGTPLVGFAAAHVVLEIGDNVFVSGAFSFRMGEVETVQVVTGGLPPLDRITDLNVRTIKVGAEGVSVFLGDGLADYDIDADLADYLSTDTPAVVLVGQTVGNLVDGKIYRRVGSSLGSVGGPALDLAGQDYFDASVWRPVAADFVGGQTAAVAVGETVGVFDTGAATYRVFERLNTGLASGPLSELVADYTGSADWVELTVFFNGDGTLNMDELGPDAVGFFVEDGALGLVLASAQTSQLPVNTAHRTKSFTALKATAASVGLVGFEDAGFVFTLRDIVVEVNSGSPVLPGQVAPTIDWAGSFPATGGYPVETGDPDNPVLIDFRGTPLVGFAAAHVVLEIGDNVFVSGAFSFRMGEVETVQVVTGGLPPLDRITDLNVRTIKVGAEGVSVFLGDGLADYDIDADLADYLSTDTPAVVLVGQTVGNLVDGKIYRRVGSSLGSVGGPALDLAGQDYFDASVWRPVAADFVGGQTAAVAVGETVGVFDTGAATYRVFERLNTGLASGPLSELVADYTGSADWVELTVFFNGDGTLNMDELGPDAVGFFVEDGALGLVLASAQTSQLPVNTAHRTKSFTALKATAASVGLVGFEDAGFVFTLRDIVVEVNSGSPVLPGQVAPTIDWAGSFPATGGYPVETGDPDNPVLIDFRGTPLVGFAAAHVVLEIGDNVFVSGAFSFRMGEVETVQVVTGGLPPLDRITDLNVRTIKVGAEGVSVFLGDGLADYDIDADLADYLSTDTPAVVLVGQTVGNLVDGKIYRRVGSQSGFGGRAGAGSGRPGLL